jgi:hypothetical protein
MLWPEKRTYDDVLGNKGVGLIQRTTETSWVTIPSGFLPGWQKTLLGWALPGVVTANGDVKIGPIPKGTPVGLIGNLDPLPEDPSWVATLSRGWKLLRIAFRLRHDLAAMPAHADDATAARIFEPLERELYALSNCPDSVVNRGHYFGTDQFDEEPGLTDADKLALIEFLKTF